MVVEIARRACSLAGPAFFARESLTGSWAPSPATLSRTLHAHLFASLRTVRPSPHPAAPRARLQRACASFCAPFAPCPPSRVQAPPSLGPPGASPHPPFPLTASCAAQIVFPPHSARVGAPSYSYIRVRGALPCCRRSRAPSLLPLLPPPRQLQQLAVPSVLCACIVRPSGRDLRRPCLRSRPSPRSHARAPPLCPLACFYYTAECQLSRSRAARGHAYL